MNFDILLPAEMEKFGAAKLSVFPFSTIYDRAVVQDVHKSLCKIFTSMKIHVKMERIPEIMESLGTRYHF